MHGDCHSKILSADEALKSWSSFFPILGTLVFGHISATSRATEHRHPKIWGSRRRPVHWSSHGDCHSNILSADEALKSWSSFFFHFGDPCIWPYFSSQ